MRQLMGEVSRVPIKHHTWIDDGTFVLKEWNYACAVELQGNLMGTKARSARGRRVENVNCDLCHRQPETLGHIQQQCWMVHGNRVDRHNHIQDYLVCRLEDVDFCCKKELVIPTQAGNCVPGVVAWQQDLGSWVLDVQVVADSAAGDLTKAHQRKVVYYE